ncbi:MAG: methionine synthase [Christensenellaceae bacterium]|nr:methionine synthase [Christensenellaceae bacterium]
MATIDLDEALRYLGVRSDPDGTMRGRMAELAEELQERIAPRYALRVATLTRNDAGMRLEGAGVILPGRLAQTMLADCGHAAILVCTLGAAFDAWMRTMQVRDMANAVMLDALGSAWVETGCDEAEKELAGRFPGMHLTDRFSPGYGDLPLSLQPDILAATDAARRLGVQATESCLLIPQKTVTAVIGIADRPQRARIRGCAHCPMRGECDYRKGGTSCEV